MTQQNYYVKNLLTELNEVKARLAALEREFMTSRTGLMNLEGRFDTAMQGGQLLIPEEGRERRWSAMVVQQGAEDGEWPVLVLTREG